MSRIADFVCDLVFPNRCPFCDRFIPWNFLCCPECREKLETADFCPTCGMAACVCGAAEFSYDSCAVARPYTGLVREGILRLKYNRGFNAAKLICAELSEKLKSLDIPQSADLITAVPMTKSRRRSTGYNQAEYIAKLLSKSLGLPLDFKLIGKNKTASAQHKLSAEERREAARSAYFAPKSHADISGKTVILCDDIITTGSTLSECAAVLKAEGASRVCCAVLSGTLLSPDKNIKE